MGSAVIKPRQNRRATDTAQMTLSFEPGLSDRYRSLRECIASGVYKQGLSAVAIDLDKAPGNLSVELSDDPMRKFGVDSFETYLEKSKDYTPIYYLVEKFLGEPTATENAAFDEVRALAQQMQLAMRRAGMA